MSTAKMGKNKLILSHEACDAFWDYWEENGATHKHGYYESTWGAIRAYIKKAEEAGGVVLVDLVI